MLKPQCQYELVRRLPGLLLASQGEASAAPPTQRGADVMAFAARP
jgi:hypothetical protein